MAWIRVDDHFDEHPKLSLVGPLGWGVWLAGLAYCNRNLTDGFVPWAKAQTLASYSLCTEKGVVTLSYTQGHIGQDVDSKWIIDLLVSAGLWEVAPGGYQIHDYHKYQPTKAGVLSDREHIREVRSTAGKQGVSKREANRKQGVSKREANIEANDKQTSSPNPNPKERESTPHTPQARVRAQFERWWSDYPRHRRVGKQAAWREWQRIEPTDEQAAQMATVLALQKQSSDWVKEGGKFVPHPRTYLHQGRWEDENAGFGQASTVIGPPALEHEKWDWCAACDDAHPVGKCPKAGAA